MYILLLLCIALPVGARDYDRLATRARDHYEHDEWREVIYLTNRMVNIRPEDVRPYSAALIAAQYLSDTDTENRYLILSQQNRIPIDTLLQSVYNRARTRHDTQVYEGLLLNLKANNGWLSKVFNHYLLDYYAFARQTDKTIAIANELLQVTPENTRYIKIKADALFYQGDEKEAVELYEKLLDVEPTHYETLTLLGAYYASQGCKALDEIDTLYVHNPEPVDSVYMNMRQLVIDSSIACAIDYMQRSQAIRPSDYLTKQITLLKEKNNKLPEHSGKSSSIFARLRGNHKDSHKEQPKE